MIKESTGMRNGDPIYCTVNGWGCPYYEDGICYIADPIAECNDFSLFFETWEDWDNAQHYPNFIIKYMLIPAPATQLTFL